MVSEFVRSGLEMGDARVGGLLHKPELVLRSWPGPVSVGIYSLRAVLRSGKVGEANHACSVLHEMPRGDTSIRKSIEGI